MERFQFAQTFGPYSKIRPAKLTNHSVRANPERLTINYLLQARRYYRHLCICINQKGNSLGQRGTQTFRVKQFFTIARTSRGEIFLCLGKENTTLHLPVLLTPGKRVNKDCSRKINDTFPPFEKSKHRLSKIKSEKKPRNKTKQIKSKRRKGK